MAIFPDSVVEQRKFFLTDLQARVDYAFENRRPETLLNGGNNSQEMVDSTARQLEFLRNGGFDDYPEVPAIKHVDDPFSVSVENSHDFRDLLTMGFKKLPPNQSPTPIPEKVDRMLKHEHVHAVPALGDENVRLRYAIDFIEAGPRIGLRGRIIILGPISLHLYQEMAAQVHNPSKTDKMVLDQKKS